MERQERKKKERKEIQGFLRFIIQAKIDSFFSFVFQILSGGRKLASFVEILVAKYICTCNGLGAS